MKTERTKKPRATQSTKEARIESILRIKFDGAEPWDVRQFVADSEKAFEGPWKIGRGEKPLSERQIRRYGALADERIAETVRTLNPEAFHLHLARVNRLFFKATQAGDLSNARAILHDLAKLHDLYPPKGVRLSGNACGYLDLHADLAEMTDEEMEAELKRLQAILPSEPQAGAAPADRLNASGSRSLDGADGSTLIPEANAAG